MHRRVVQLSKPIPFCQSPPILSMAFLCVFISIGLLCLYNKEQNFCFAAFLYKYLYFPLYSNEIYPYHKKVFFSSNNNCLSKTEFILFLFQFRLSFYLFSHFVFKLLNPFISYIGIHLTVRLLWFFPYSLFLCIY